ncbi:uncharacterized protein LOC130644276 [Hydractinia symbiolongicarpus]|uniref:uncharacterized protein LOC130644275 n=1 Tax=Hydractinia symbiolongicarpus TaxID=13093 RepID=UPI00254B0FC6|nr:uncharacterized protein LOC130644275 [Hydractinia symbiolongicarpus]XP_057305796.1 uncharacterized protein LOC130644276 [Hydractinia symbiolongicarpus]
MMRYLAFLLLVSLAMVHANFFRNDYRREGRLAALRSYQDYDMEKRGANNCMYTEGKCSGWYSYGCRTGACWRQCWSGARTWCYQKNGKGVKKECSTDDHCKISDTQGAQDTCVLFWNIPVCNEGAP